MANRRQRRKLSRFGIGQKVLEEATLPLINKTKTMAYRMAFGGMMLALHNDYGFELQQLEDLAIKTVMIIQNSLTPTEIRDTLLEKTGFDVDKPIEADRLGLEI